MTQPSKIAKKLVRAVDNEGNIEERKVACDTFWSQSPCVIIFFRRFGCQLCRMNAFDLSENLKPLLDKHKIRLIGIGFDSKFVKSFMNEGYWKGELYLDSDRECYQALNLEKYSCWQLFNTLISLKTLEAIRKIFQKGIKGDFKGDGMQSGGALVVDKGGKQLLEYRQENMTDLVSIDDVLKSLNIKNE